MFRQASRVLSTVSGHPALVLAPRPQGMRLKHVQFINLGGDGVLTVLVSQDNQVQTRFVRSHTRYTQEQLTDSAGISTSSARTLPWESPGIRFWPGWRKKNTCLTRWCPRL